MNINIKKYRRTQFIKSILLSLIMSISNYALGNDSESNGSNSRLKEDVKVASWGGDHSGGGVGYLCSDAVILADTYDLFYSTKEYADIVKEFQNYSTEDAVQLLVLKIATKNRKFANDLMSKLLQLKFTNISGEIRKTNDHNLSSARCPKGKGQIVQLARQKDGSVELSELTNKMLVIESAILRLHEARLNFEIESNHFFGDTSPIRQSVKHMIRLALSDLDELLLNYRNDLQELSSIDSAIDPRDLWDSYAELWESTHIASVSINLATNRDLYEGYRHLLNQIQKSWCQDTRLQELTGPPIAAVCGR